MSEYIEREDVDNVIAKVLSGYLYDEERERLENIIAGIEEIPAVNVVRCKDCEHCEKRRTANYEPFFYCLIQECSVKNNDFCSYGKRNK